MLRCTSTTTQETTTTYTTIMSNETPNETSNENNSPATPPSSAPEPAPEPSLISGTNTATSSDWPTIANPTGWRKSAEHLNVAKEGLVGHCWKALTVTTEYPSIHTIHGIQTDSHQPFFIEHSMDGEVWTAVEGEFTGDNQDVEQPIEPFACRYTRMSWATTDGTNGIHAQFVGVECGDEGEEEGGAESAESAESGEGGSASPESLPNSCENGGENGAECASSPSLPCIDSAFSGACDALQEKVSGHLARVDASEKEAEDKYRSEYDEDRDDWEERLEEGVRDFEKHYDEQMATLRETLRAKKEAHEARLAEIEQAFLTDRQAALDEAKQRMQDKLVDFEVDVLGEQV